MDQLTTIAEGLHFPEGPVWLEDGSVLVVELGRATLTRVHPDGRSEIVAETGGGPNGAAVGPDGKVWLCNNGGYFSFNDEPPFIPGPTPDTYAGGSIQAVSLDDGAVETLHRACDGKPLVAPNDLVFDADGGCWFTDHGVQHGEHAESPGLLYIPAGGAVQGVVWGLESANGVGLSPDGRRVYVAETHPGRVWAFDITAPGAVAGGGGPHQAHEGTLLHDAADGVLFDSLAVDGEGWVCVATIGPGGVTAISPDGANAELVETGDFLTTNVAVGGPDGATAAYTLSSSGRLATGPWPRPGLTLGYRA